jgi:hypothetical protein
MKATLAAVAIVGLIACCAAADKEEPKDAKKTQVYIINTMIPGLIKPEKLKKTTLDLEVTDNSPQGFTAEDSLKKVVKVDGDVPKEGKVYMHETTASFGGRKEERPVLVYLPQKVKVGTKFTGGKLVGQFKADVTGLSGATYYVFEGTLQEKSK